MYRIVCEDTNEELALARTLENACKLAEWLLVLLGSRLPNRNRYLLVKDADGLVLVRYLPIPDKIPG